MKIEDLLTGVKIIAKYDDGYCVAAEHDQIYVGDYECTHDLMTSAERVKMIGAGWFKAEGAWSHFT